MLPDRSTASMRSRAACGGDGDALSVFGLPIRMPGGEDSVDEATLQRIASMTGGKSFRARDTDQLAGIYAEIDRIEPIRPRVEPVPLVRRGSERDPYEKQKERRREKRRERPRPEEPGEGHVDVRA